MRFHELLDAVSDLPLFRSSLLLAGDRDPADVRRQLTRWTAAGRLVQLRRNVYVLARPWRKVEPHPFVIANELHGPSYVSLQSALAWYGMIPEAVPVTTSVTSGRPMTLETPLGRFQYRHIGGPGFFGYGRVQVHPEHSALVAGAAKALLDLVHLTRAGETVEHLDSLRLEALESVPARELRAHAARWGRNKIARAADNLLRLKDPALAGGERR